MVVRTCFLKFNMGKGRGSKDADGYCAVLDLIGCYLTWALIGCSGIVKRCRCILVLLLF